ncbi:DUF6153 family protein [Streptomyces sp. NPDC049585]|uniref:DUF6153 family protein n=1 Tax=Streptomyces sp. NPDC049585 TaxID=3155154 RepID=UPI00341818F8
MQGRRGIAARCGRPLLLAALLLGIVTMHTLGHPGGHAEGSRAGAVTAAAGEHAPDRAGAHGGERHHEGGGTPAMDPSSVCLAVLAVGWTLLALLALAGLCRPGARPAPAARPWFSRALWPHPPPPRHKSLARLSVLRV